MYRKYQISLLVTVTILLTSNVRAQENPWVTTSQQENPWGTEEKSEKNNKATEKAVIDTIETSVEPNQSISLPTKEVTIIDSDSHASLIQIEDEANASFKAPGAFAGSFVTGLIFNVFSIPINAIIATAPTLRTKHYERSFQEQNPDATISEKRAFRRGIRKKRAGRAAAGTICGIAGQILIIIGISRS